MPKLTNIEIENIESVLCHKLPGLYHRLLLEIGHGQIGTHAQIYHPLTVRELYEPFFDDPSQLFGPYFPFGCQNRTTELWIINAATETAASIWHETVPVDWPEEKWLPYERWIEEHLQPELPDS